MKLQLQKTFSHLLGLGVALGTIACAGAGNSPQNADSAQADGASGSPDGTSGVAAEHTAQEGAASSASLPEDGPRLSELKESCADGEGLSLREEEKACRDAATLMGENMAKAGCGAIEAYWQQSIEVDSDIKPLLHNSYGLKAAQCERWDIVFEELMHWGNGTGYEMVVALDEAGIPVEKQFLSYLQKEAKPLHIEHSKYAFMNYMHWKTQQEGGAPCDAYVPALKKVNDEAFHVLLANFRDMECAVAADPAAKALAADRSATRIVACQLLGKVGGPEYLSKVEILAEKDGYSTEKGDKVIYPVRDACSSAAAKIELRQ